MNRSFAVPIAVLALAAVAGADISYAVWDQENATATSVTGVLTLADSSTVNVTLTGPLFFVQGNNQGTNYWADNPETYEGPGIPNAPETSDIVALIGGGDSSYTLTFDRPVFDIVMPVISLGRGSTPVDYVFDRDFTIISEGPGYFGEGDLSQPDGNTLLGVEGNGSILFDGATNSLTWTVDTAENWHGFTLGVAGAVPEPGTMAVLGLGALALLKRRKKQ